MASLVTDTERVEMFLHSRVPDDGFHLLSHIIACQGWSKQPSSFSDRVAVDRYHVVALSFATSAFIYMVRAYDFPFYDVVSL